LRARGDNVVNSVSECEREVAMIRYGFSSPYSEIGSRLSDVSTRVQSPTPFDPNSRGAVAQFAGNGGNGTAVGAILNQSETQFSPINLATSAEHASASAHQSNWLNTEQASAIAAGVGGDGGNGNMTTLGNPSFDIAQSSLPAGNTAHVGNGGDGVFAGSLVHTSIALYDPINIAVAGSESDATADQANSTRIDQSAIQLTGIGGNGGSANISDQTLGQHTASGQSTGPSPVPHLSEVGNGGDGIFAGSLVSTSFVIYHPMNIAIAGDGAQAHADQTNDVAIDQHTLQVAGVGGHGGSGNAAIDQSTEASILHLIGSDAVGFDGNSVGSGGGGSFMGTLADIDIVVYAPINIAVAGYHSTADAHQSNSVMIDQSTSQLAGIGGTGGGENEADGGHSILDFLYAAHL
jgi:hypothetical protein